MPTATGSPWLRQTMTIAEFERRLPTMGSRPTIKVSATRVFTSGSSTPNRLSTMSRYSPGEQGVDQRDPRLGKYHALKYRGQARRMPRDHFGQWPSVGRDGRLLHRQQGTNDHAHEDVRQGAADAATGELQRTGIGAQPLGDRDLQGFGILRDVPLQSFRKDGARVLDDLRHALHQQRHAFVAVAQKGGDTQGDAATSRR